MNVLSYHLVSMYVINSNAQICWGISKILDYKMLLIYQHLKNKLWEQLFKRHFSRKAYLQSHFCNPYPSYGPLIVSLLCTLRLLKKNNIDMITEEIHLSFCED